MADTEVESILREIRERVLSQQRAGHDVAAGSVRPKRTNDENGAGGSAAGETMGTAAAENMALINSYLTTTARTWDRLPPVVSNRSGLAARLELWLKRRLRSATRWFTWEQVNFNAAAHHALRDMLPLFSAYEQELGKLHAQIGAQAADEAAARRSDFEEYQTKLTALRVELRDMIEKHSAELNARVGELASELRDRDELLREEQRVCFKQLVLETSEAAVLEDRARRKAEALLAELQQRVSELEKR
jgi:hypothetical protein